VRDASHVRCDLQRRQRGREWEDERDVRRDRRMRGIVNPAERLDLIERFGDRKGDDRARR
jgi:hypothetical protein